MTTAEINTTTPPPVVAEVSAPVTVPPRPPGWGFARYINHLGWVYAVYNSEEAARVVGKSYVNAVMFRVLGDGEAVGPTVEDLQGAATALAGLAKGTHDHPAASLVRSCRNIMEERK